MDNTVLIPILLSVENRVVEGVKSPLYAWKLFSALDANVQAFIIQIIAALVGIVLALLFMFNLFAALVQVPVIVGEVGSGVTLSFGSAGIQYILNFIAAWSAVGTQKAQVAKATAESRRADNVRYSVVATPPNIPLS